MLEQIQKSFNKKITREINKISAQLNGSLFEDEAISAEGIPSLVQGPMKQLLKKIDKKADPELVDEKMRSKCNKQEMEMALRQMSTLHQQLKQLSLLMTQKMKESLDPDSSEPQN